MLFFHEESYQNQRNDNLRLSQLPSVLLLDVSSTKNI